MNWQPIHGVRGSAFQRNVTRASLGAMLGAAEQAGRPDMFLKRYEDGPVRIAPKGYDLKRSAKCSTIEANFNSRNILRKEVIQPQVPLRLPCYDFTPVAEPTVVRCLKS